MAYRDNRDTKRSFFPCSSVAFFLLGIVSGVALAQSQPSNSLPATVSEALRRAAIPSSAVAVWVQPVGIGASAQAPRLAVNAAQAMNPASTMKLLTSFAALELLGPTYNWKTQVYAEGTLQGDVLQGNLVIKGGGDPKLNMEQLWLMLRAVRARGVREIRGDLLLDRSWLARSESAQHDPAGFDGDAMKPYNVGPDALLLNFKTVRFTFVPEADGRSVRVISEPPLSQLELRSTVRGVDGACGDWLARLRSDFQMPSEDVLRASFSGSYPLRCGERTWNVALLSHPAFVLGTFRALWKELGGSFSGRLREGNVPGDARLLWTQESPPLAEVVRDINKFSNNVMARQLYLTLGSLPDATAPGNAEDNLAARSDRATAVIRNWLAQRRLNIPELVMENGSGLSRIERISAAKLGEVLNAAFASSVMPEFMSSLPVAALDGTMRRRLRSDALAGQAHIKTGSLNDVRSIAGYVLSASGQRHAVVCFIQHANAQAGQAAQDALLRWVYELPSEPGANPAAATPPATTTPPARTPARRTERPHAAPAPHRG